MADLRGAWEPRLGYLEGNRSRKDLLESSALEEERYVSRVGEEEGNDLR